MDKFKNKYRIPTTRLKSWDYGNNGAYFITINTANRKHFFGAIQNKKMQLNKIGLLAEKYWAEIPNHFPFVALKNFVVMPNHVHGILVVETRFIAPPQAPQAPPSPSSPPSGGITGKSNPMLHENISRIIRWYKGRCTYEIRKTLSGFSWQTRFHDHIIRNNRALKNIQNYITDNPSKWDERRN